MSKPTSVYIDDDKPRQHDELIRRAVEHVQKIAADDPELAVRGFGIAVTDEQDKVLFRVVYSGGNNPRVVTVH